MANWNTLKTAVADIINTNGNQAITGQLLQNVLNNIITNVGENATFAGIATLDTNPGAPDGPVFYLAATAGTYPNFNGIEVQDGEVVILLWNNNAWSKKVTGFTTQEKLSQLGSDLEGKTVLNAVLLENDIIPLDGIKSNIYISSTEGVFVKGDTSTKCVYIPIDGNTISGCFNISYNNDQKYSVIAFLKSKPSLIAREKAEFCEDYAAPIRVTSETVYKIPTDCKYVYTYLEGNGLYFEPIIRYNVLKDEQVSFGFRTENGFIRQEGDRLIWKELYAWNGRSIIPVISDSMINGNYYLDFIGGRYICLDRQMFVSAYTGDSIKLEELRYDELNSNKIVLSIIASTPNIFTGRLYELMTSYRCKKFKEDRYLHIERLAFLYNIKPTDLTINGTTDTYITNTDYQVLYVPAADFVGKRLRFEYYVGANKTRIAFLKSHSEDVEQGSKIDTCEEYPFSLVLQNSYIDVTVPTDCAFIYIILGLIEGNQREFIPSISILTNYDEEIKELTQYEYLYPIETYNDVVIGENGLENKEGVGAIVNVYNIKNIDTFYINGHTPLSIDYSNNIAFVNGDNTFMSYKFLLNSGRYENIKISNKEGYNKILVFGSTSNQPSLQTKVCKSNSTNLLNGKKISILGDSISTCIENNAVEFTVLNSDVNKEIEGYPTYYDIGTIIGGKQVTSEMVGVKTSFTPTTEDIGKVIGKPLNYNNLNQNQLWWGILAERTGATILQNVSWSGSSISSHEASQSKYKTSYAWHDAQINKLSSRDDYGNVITPDIIIVYRGTNDMTHSPYTKLTDFGLGSMSIPNTDEVDGGFGFKEAYCMTIKKIREKYPNALIVCCTLNVFKRINYNEYPTNNGINTIPQYSSAIREIANYMGCGLIEFDKDGITFENCYPTYISDSATIPTHPNAVGHAKMAEKAIKDIMNI